MNLKKSKPVTVCASESKFERAHFLFFSKTAQPDAQGTNTDPLGAGANLLALELGRDFD